MKKHDLCRRSLVLHLETMAQLSLLLSDGRVTVQPDPLRELVAAARKAAFEYFLPERLAKALELFDDLEV